MHEIERKFLVTKPLQQIVGPNLAFGKRVEQCYLPDTGDWTVRVRRVTMPSNREVGIGFNPYALVECTQTMKRKVSDRKSVELETPVTDAYFEKVKKQSGKVLEKTRFEIFADGHTWEIDVFPQFNNLVVAEIELDEEDEHFEHPDWLGQEVTHDKSFKNVRMAKKL